MPDVIEHRKKTLSNQDNETLIAGDLFDMRWADEVPTDRPVMILLLGVFQYFHEEEIVDIIGKMKGRFPGTVLGWITCTIWCSPRDTDSPACMPTRHTTRWNAE